MKNRITCILSAVFILCVGTSALHAAMEDDIDRAVSIIERFQEIPETAIPPAVLRDAKGLAILTMTKAGFIVSGRGGTGVVVARTTSAWSGPSAIGTGGLGVGFQAGVQVSEYVIILNTQEAVNAFSKGNNVTLGGNLSAAIGPIGRSAEASVLPQATIYTYSRTKEFLPVFHWKGRLSRPAIKRTKNITASVFPSDILAGDVKPPASAQKLLDILAKY
jgi:SH3 domain-containing YSC84-like protein 1